MRAMKITGALAILSVILLFVSACGDKEDREHGRLGTTFKTPPPLGLASPQIVQSMKCELIRDGNKTYPLDVDANGNCQGIITNQPLGTHDLTLRFFVMYPPPSGANKVILAWQTITVTVVEDQSITATFLNSGYTYPDTDGDDFTNLEEIIRGYDPLIYCQDGDTDGFQAQACGGDDCNDNDPLSRPGGSPYGPPQRITVASGASLYPSLVWTGSEFGVAWQDGRDGGSEIYFVRISSSGVRFGQDQRITNDPAESASPSLSWTGSEFGVSWHDHRDPYSQIYFVRLSAVGAKIGSDLRITNGTGGMRDLPSLSWTGTEFGVSWYDSMDWQIYFTRISSVGTKIGSDIKITDGGGNRFECSLTWTGSEFGLSWPDPKYGNAEIYFARLSPDGDKIGLDLSVTYDPGASQNPSLLWTGSEFAVSWNDDRDGNNEIYFSRISADGNKIGSDMRITNNSATSLNPSLVWNGVEYGVSWEDNRDGGNGEIYFALISESGTKIGSDQRITNTSMLIGGPSLVWTGSEFVVSWHYDAFGTNQDYEIYFNRIIYSCP